MKGFKRLVAGILATLMIATSMNVTSVFAAEEYTDEQKIVVSKVSAANVMTGTNKGFEGDKTLTRAEAAAIVVRMKGISDSQVAGSKGETLFSDVSAAHWASGYINVATSMNIISGVGNGLFQPEREVTVAEFVAMAIRSIGAGTLVNSLGKWPTNYTNFAAEEGLLDGVSKIHTAKATRFDAAFITANALTADMWEKSQVTNTSEVTYAKSEGKTLLENVLKIKVAESVIISDINMKDRNADFTGDARNWGNYDIVDSVELATFKSGMEVDVWANTDDREIVRIYPAETSKQNMVSFTEIVKVDTSNNKITLLVDGNEKRYSYEDDTTEDDSLVINYNYDLVDDDVDETDTNELNDVIVKSNRIFGTAILDGSKIVTLYAEEFKNWGVVKEIKNDRIYFNSDIKMATNNKAIDLDDDDLQFAVTKNDKEISVEDIEEEDVLFYYTDGDEKYTINVINNTVEGTVQNVATNKYVKMDGKKYNVANDDTNNISAGDEIVAYLNQDDELVMYEMIEGAVDSTVAMVKSLRAITDNYGEENLEIVLTKLDGTEIAKKVIDLEETIEKFNDSDYDTTLELVKAIYNPSALDTDYDNNMSSYSITEKYEQSIVGELIRYTLKSGDVVIREFLDNDIETSYEDAKLEYFTGASYSDSNRKIKKDTETIARLNSNTVIYVVKNYEATATKAAYSTRFEKIDFEDLGDGSNLSGFIVGADKDTGEVDAVLFTTTVRRATSENYAVVLGISSVSSDDDEDYNYEYELLLSDGSVEEVLVDEDAEGYEVGDIIEAFISDDVLTDAENVTNKKVTYGFLYTIDGNIASVLEKVGTKLTLTFSNRTTSSNDGFEIKIDNQTVSYTLGSSQDLTASIAAIKNKIDTVLNNTYTVEIDGDSIVIVSQNDTITYSENAISNIEVAHEIEVVVSKNSPDLAENVMFVKVDEDEADDLTDSEISNAELTVGRERDIEEIASSIRTYADAIDEEATELKFVYGENSETNDIEIIAIFYRG